MNKQKLFISEIQTMEKDYSDISHSINHFSFFKLLVMKYGGSNANNICKAMSSHLKVDFKTLLLNHMANNSSFEEECGPFLNLD